MRGLLESGYILLVLTVVSFWSVLGLQGGPAVGCTFQVRTKFPD